MKKDKDTTAPSTEKRAAKKSRFARVLILVLVFCIAVVAALVVSDFFFSDDKDGKPQPEVVAVCVAGDRLILNNGREVTLAQLREYMNELKISGKNFVASLINDTANPADVNLYNQVVDLLAEFDIVCEKLPGAATPEEATPDEVPTTAFLAEESTAATAA